MTTNPSRELLKVFVLIISLATRMHAIQSEVVVVCCSTHRFPSGMRIIIFQVIQLHLGEWEAVVVYYRRLGDV